MATIQISANYWNSLNNNEKKFINENVYTYGVQTCKQVLSLAKYIPNWTEIKNYSDIIDDELMKCIAGANWCILRDNKKIAVILNSCGFGISKRIKINTENGWLKVWDNFHENKPSKKIIDKINELIIK